MKSTGVVLLSSVLVPGSFGFLRSAAPSFRLLSAASFATSRAPIDGSDKNILRSQLPPLDENDLEEKFVRGSGNGGQKVNKTSNQVVLRHIPSGIVVNCHQTRSLEQNRKIARSLLRVKIDDEMNGARSKSSVKARMKSDKKKKNKAKAKARRKKKEVAMTGGSLIEVEKKFSVPDNIELLVESLGGDLVGTCEFEDFYVCEALAERDMWLRRRCVLANADADADADGGDGDGDGDGDGEEGGVWELKIPASVGVKSGGETTAFREIVGFSNVVEALSMLDPPVNVEAVLSSTTFANFVTRRKKFVVEGVNVDCDFADFKGFGGIMELEILVEGSDDIADARRKIDDVAKKLKAEPLGESAGGKLETFLRNEADGPFLQTLIDNGVLT